MKSALTALLVAGVFGGGIFYWMKQPSPTTGPGFRTVPVKREELVVQINATGTVEPEEVVDVGAQVAGRIVSFGEEPKTGTTIDYNSKVEPGTVLARIDDVLYVEEVNLGKAQLAKAQAHLEQTKTQVSESEAGVERADADLKQMEARFAQAERDYGRAQKLLSTNALSQQEYDTVRAAFETSQATVGVGKAAGLQARAAVETAKAAVTEAEADVSAAQAALNRAARNLDYTVIRSPIAGEIIDRRVNIGQTVVASLNAPSLFLIAKDLRRVEVWASVNEADIGRVRQGQPVRFSFDNDPQTYEGRVEQIRLNATMTQNVVTYTVIVSADNSAGTMRPYQTANLQFEVSRNPSALVVPGAALRWRPKPEQVAPEFRQHDAAATDAKPPTNRGFVWIVDGPYVRPLPVMLGASDSGRTEIISDDVDEGTAVVVGEQVQSDTSGEFNPLAPRAYGGSKAQGN